MKVSLIAAIGKQRQLGLAGSIPWHIPSELKNFKRLTMNHHVVMGRKTFESLPGSLPGRKILVLTHTRAHFGQGAQAVLTPTAALEVAQKCGEEELFICGGAQVYVQYLKLASRFYLSQVDYTGQADTFFPPFEHLDWQATGKALRHDGKEDESAWNFQILQRKTQVVET